MNVMRKGYPDVPAAIAGGIEQMEEAKLVGFVVSAQDAKLRHIAASEAMARSNYKSREMMNELRGNLKVEPLSPEALSSRVYPGRKY